MLKKGRGLAAIYYPTGFNGGGDMESVTLRLKRDGTIDITNPISDLGQGLKMACIMIVAEALQVDVKEFVFDNTNTDTCAYGIGAAGSRSSYVMGNAALDASSNFIEKIKEYGATMLELDPSEVEYQAGEVRSAQDPEKKVTLRQIGEEANPTGHPIMAVGAFRPPKVPTNPETGAGLPSRTMAWGATIADVFVDDETGVVTVDKLYSCYDIGTIINTLAAQGQVDGGDVMGIGMGLFEDLTPGYPDSIELQTANYTDYIIPTFMDIPSESTIEFVDTYDPYGPYGAKGLGEMVNNSQPAAIANAIYDAVGVWATSLPMTPEKILRLIDEKAGEQAS
jgi:CO/xanthine dehydrogenase Mo-binding subunit